MSASEPPQDATPVAEPRGSVLRKDVVAGLINAVVSVPDGLASAALAGVNPVYGLYTSIAAPISGSLLVSAQLRHAGKLDLDRAVQLVPADDVLGVSTGQAWAHASAWLGGTHDNSPRRSFD